MNTELETLLYTTQDRAELLRELDLCKRTFFQASQTPTPDLAHLGIRERALPFWTAFFASPQSGVAALETLRAQIAAYRVVRVTLAFEPDTHFIHKLVIKIRAVTGVTQYLVAIDVVATLSAGLIVTIDGKLFDLSLEKKLRSLDFAALTTPFLPVLSS